ncbi:MAG: aminopeptidase [Caldilineaceae bacterium]
MGEVALVDVRSPINQAGVIFYETLFDENAVRHIAFGEAYPGRRGRRRGHERRGSSAPSASTRPTPNDFMIGTPTMDVDGVTADDRTIPIMRAGRFVADVA